MAMGFGCNAAGVIATRVIDSPRERLIAILTNNFVPCNGRFPTLVMLATIFVAAAFPPAVASLIAAGAVVGVVLIGVAFTLLTSWLLAKTMLQGEASAFTLELPPYRRPSILRILYTSLIDRTIFGVHGKPVQLQMERLWSHNITLTTRLVDTAATPMLMKMVDSGRLQPKALVTHRFQLDATMKAYDTFGNAAREGALKVVLGSV
jgi:hypothetical protein